MPTKLQPITSQQKMKFQPYNRYSKFAYESQADYNVNLVKEEDILEWARKEYRGNIDISHARMIYNKHTRNMSPGKKDRRDLLRALLIDKRMFAPDRGPGRDRGGGGSVDHGGERRTAIDQHQHHQHY
ncbi:hypothetical protein BGX29_005703 [Mortierella sp. GBA35]|nr:hypothetical protein BGX29_005703 [Mortierella sp. GBA35]